MKIKFLKLINNERINKKLVSAKACQSDGTAVDYCHEKDNASCTLYAYDECTKDYAGCSRGADDICGEDYAACFGAGVDDLCATDLDAN